MNSIFGTTTIPVLEQLVAFTEARHEILAGNIANLDTPGFQAQDLPIDTFQEHLRAVLASSDRPVASEGYESQGYESQGYKPDSNSRGERLRAVKSSLHSMLRHDGSNVGLEQQVTELGKNQMLHNLAVSIMTSQFRLLQTAVSERV